METTTVKNSSYKNIDILNFETIEPLLKGLANQAIDSKDSLEQWLKDSEELEAELEEKERWISLNSRRDTGNELYQKNFKTFIEEVKPKINPYYAQFNNKLTSCPHVDELDQDQYFIYLRKIKSLVELYRKENEALFAKTRSLSNQYFEIKGKSSVIIQNEEVTLDKASTYLEFTDRAIRKEAYEKILEQNISNRTTLDDIFNQLVELRHQIALNAGYDNFRDYSFEAMGRFDYTPNDCLQFHDSIQEVLLPIINKIYSKRKQGLNYEQLKPYDLNVETNNKAPMQPFANIRDLINKTIEALSLVDVTFGQYLKDMDKKGFLDLESRKNKAPGGFLMPLPVSKAAYIFMNATSTVRDIRVLTHEGGHAVHEYLMADLPEGSLKGYGIPSEVAEYAAMTMELLAMEHWDVFFSNEDDLKRAKLKYLERMMTFYPVIALVDRFQHWLYLNPTHTSAQRNDKWVELFNKFDSPLIDYKGYEEAKEISWQSRLHIFFGPFYYIEYAMARLGSIATWKLYKTDPKQAVQNYKNALSLGYTKTIPEIYKAAQIEFDFSKNYVQELFDFVYEEYLKLQ